MSRLDDKLKSLYEQQEKLGAEILKTRKQLLPIKLKRLLKARERCHPNEIFGFTGFLKSAIETPDDVSVIGIYPFDKLTKFCFDNDIPFMYDNVGDEYRGDVYKNFRVGFRD